MIREWRCTQALPVETQLRHRLKILHADAPSALDYHASAAAMPSRYMAKSRGNLKYNDFATNANASVWYRPKATTHHHRCFAEKLSEPDFYELLNHYMNIIWIIILLLNIEILHSSFVITVTFQTHLQIDKQPYMHYRTVCGCDIHQIQYTHLRAACFQHFIQQMLRLETFQHKID